MTIIEVFVLILLIVLVAGLAAYQVGKSYPPMKDMVKDVKDIEVIANQVANELYNKDLRPIAAKKTPKKKEVTSEDITPEVIDAVISKAKITLNEASLDLKEVIKEVKETKSEFPIDKPKKKRKYYPKKPKTSI